MQTSLNLQILESPQYISIVSYLFILPFVEIFTKEKGHRCFSILKENLNSKQNNIFYMLRDILQFL